jgi:hypothetical protein
MGVVLGQDRDNDAGSSQPWLLWMVRALAGTQRIEFAKPIGRRAAVKVGSEFASFRTYYVECRDPRPARRRL